MKKEMNINTGKRELVKFSPNHRTPRNSHKYGSINLENVKRTI